MTWLPVRHRGQLLLVIRHFGLYIDIYLVHSTTADSLLYQIEYKR